MRRVKLFLVSFSIVLCAICCVTATADALPGWLIGGSILGTNQTANANFTTTGSLTIKWEDNGSAFKSKCEKGHSAELLKGGLPGTSHIESFVFEECFSTKPAGCLLTIPSATALPWLTTLETVAGWFSTTIYSTYNMDVEIEVKECTNTAFNKTWLVKGLERAVIKDLVGDVRVKFPEGTVEGDTLATEGFPVEFSGEGELEGKEKTTVQVEEDEKPEILPIPTAAAPLTFTSSNAKGILLETKVGSKMECAEGSSSGEFTGAREGTVSSTLNGCKLAGVACHTAGASAEMIVMSGAVQLVDLEKEAKLVLGFGFAPSSEVAVKCGVLSGSIKGSVIGEVSGVESGKKTKAATVSLKQEKGKQAIKECHLTKAFCEGKKFFLEANFGKGVEEAGLQTEEKLTLAKEAAFDF